MGSPSGQRLRVAVTGANGDLGQLLLPLLARDPDVEAVIALDVARPQGAKVVYRRVDLTRHDAEAELSRALEEERVDALYHLAFLFSTIRNASFAHELEVVGTLSVLAAAGRVGVRRLVVPSFTVVYGARPDHPALLTEDAPLHGCPSSRFVSDKVEVEVQVRAFHERHPATRTLVLRLAPILGPTVDNPATRLLRGGRVTTLLGYDPLWQAVHEQDVARALHLALTADAEGPFNIVGAGVLPLSGLVRQAGARPLPLPPLVARTSLATLHALGVTGVPPGLLDYVRYSWVADGTRAERVLGFVPRYHARDAAAALHRSE